MNKTRQNEKVQQIAEIQDSGEMSLPLRISWAELHGKTGIDLRKFWKKEHPNKKVELCPSGKGVRISPKQFLELIKLGENKELVRQLEETIKIDESPNS